MSAWQPIETAPKDGTKILICGGTTIKTFHRKMTKAEDEKMRYDFKGVTISMFWDKWLDGRFPWVSYQLRPAADDNIQTLHEPTHWQPLPEAPA